MKILITGPDGFIAQNMIAALKDEHELILFNWGDHLPDLEGIGLCIHLGAISSTTETDVEKIIEQNYDFSRWIIGACNYWGVPFQYASSASVYGLNSNFAENAKLQPTSPYSWSKFLFDRYVIGLHSKNFWKIKWQGFRYFNVYGPHEDHKGDQASPYFKFEKQAKETGVIKLFEGSDKFLRDFVPVETVVDVHKRFMTVDESGIWNIGTGRPTSFESVARMIADRYNAQVEYIPMPDTLKGQYQTYTCADVTRLRKFYP